MSKYKRGDEVKENVKKIILQPEVVDEEQSKLPLPPQYDMDFTPKKKYTGVPYHTSYGDRVIDEMADGKTHTEVARVLGIGLETMKKWAKEYPDFKEALSIGEELAKAWWEEQGRVNLTNPKFNARLYTFFMSNRLGYSTGTTKVTGRVEHAHAHLMLEGDDKKEKGIEDVRRENAKCAEVLDILLEVGAIKTGNQKVLNPAPE